MKITSDKFEGRAAQSSRYHEIFSKLSPAANCIVFEDEKEMAKVSQALESWAKRHIGKGCKVVTTKKYTKDGFPRCWLMWPDETKTTIRGNFPRAA